MRFPRHKIGIPEIARATTLMLLPAIHAGIKLPKFRKIMKSTFIKWAFTWSTGVGGREKQYQWSITNSLLCASFHQVCHVVSIHTLTLLPHPLVPRSVPSIPHDRPSLVHYQLHMHPFSHWLLILIPTVWLKCLRTNLVRFFILQISVLQMTEYSNDLQISHFNFQF